MHASPCKNQQERIINVTAKTLDWCSCLQSSEDLHKRIDKMRINFRNVQLGFEFEKFNKVPIMRQASVFVSEHAQSIACALTWTLLQIETERNAFLTAIATSEKQFMPFNTVISNKYFEHYRNSSSLSSPHLLTRLIWERKFLRNEDRYCKTEDQLSFKKNLQLIAIHYV